MNEEELLRSTVKWKKRPGVYADRVGTSAQRYLGERGRQFNKNAAIVDAWHRIIPEKFHEHCRIAGISKGVLRVEVESGPYMHEMQLASREILEQIQNYCGSVGIEKIRLFPRKNH